MKLQKLSVDFRQVSSLQQMHEVLAKVFEFPDFYGKNVNALIDCWSSLRYPEDGMTGIVLAQEEAVLLEVKGMSGMDQLIYNHFTISVEAVNERYVEKKQQPVMFLLPV